MAASTPCCCRWCAINVISPNHDGGAGTDSEEVWICTDPSARVVMISLLVENSGVLSPQGGIFQLMSTPAALPLARGLRVVEKMVLVPASATHFKRLSARCIRLE